MVIRECILKGTELLRASGAKTAALDARVLMCAVLNADDVYIISHDNDFVNKELENKYFEFVERRLKNEPVAYITNEKEFMSLKFYVDSRVLIPRPDTEHLAELAIELSKERNLKNIADFCCGSGAISVSVGKYCPDADIKGYDISDGALEVSEKNKILNGTENVTFEKLDVLNCLSDIQDRYDMVVSNPPYIDAKDMQTLENNVKDYEPHIALFGGEDGLDFYRVISDNARIFLNPKGVLAFEVGASQAEDVRKIMSTNFENIKIKKDYAGIDRVVWGELK